MDYDFIQLEVEADIATITFDRPEKRNATNPGMLKEIREALVAVQDRNARVLILTGNGDSFSSGMDLEEYFSKPRREGPAAFMEGALHSRNMFMELKHVGIPTIARVNGWALGGGFNIQGVCDFAIAADDATFGLPEINFGIFPAGGAMWCAVNTMSRRNAMYFAATGETFSASEAERMGVINKAVPRDQLDAEVAELTATLTELDPFALAINKEVFDRVRYMRFDDALDYEVTKLEQLHYLQEGDWLDTALSQFESREFRPGLEAYDRER